MFYGCPVNEHERRLAQVVEGILDSYREHGNINHLDGSNLPARSEVSELLDDLISVVFPGYFNGEQLDELTSRYFVGARCARILRRMEQVTARALAVHCARGEGRHVGRDLGPRARARAAAGDPDDPRAGRVGRAGGARRRSCGVQRRGDHHELPRRRRDRRASHRALTCTRGACRCCRA
jgi:hypothetical protein